MIVRILFFLLPFLLNAEIIWQTDLPKPFQIVIKMNSSTIALGNALLIDAEIHYPSSYHLDVNALIDQLTWAANPLAPEWNLVESKISSLPAKKEMKAQRLQVKIAPLVAGQRKISFLTFSFTPQEAAQSPIQISTPVFSLEVVPSQPAANLPSAPLIPLEPQFPLELTQENRELFIDNPTQQEKAKAALEHELQVHSFPWLTLVFALACGGIGWTAYLTRDRWQRHFVTPPVAISSQQQFAEALQALQNSRLDPESLPASYAEFSSVLLKALQAHLGWKTENFTTYELARAMRKQALLPKDRIEKTYALLKEIDQVKFAGKKPSQAEALQMSQNIREFIQQLLTQAHTM